jgi:hypothetical protein
MPQLDQMSFMSQIFAFILTFYTLYSLILIYLLPPIFRTLKYRVHKFELLINQINFLNLSANEGDANYINLFNKFISNNLNVITTYKKEYHLNLKTNQVNNYLNLNNVTKNTLEKIILRKTNL